MGHCLSRDSETGMLSIDTSLLDCVFRVELLSDGERPYVPDYQGGKLVETSAVDIIETWQDFQFADAAVLAIAQPYPIRFTTSPFSDRLLEDDHEASSETDCASVSSSGSRRFEAPSDQEDIYGGGGSHLPSRASMLQASQDSANESNEVDSDEGFRGARPDWFGRRVADERLDYNGGGLPAELLEALPGFYFSYHYLKMLACASRRMLRSVQDREHWRNKHISLNVSEFDDPQLVRAMSNAYSTAGVVHINVRHLAMFHIIPERMLLDWTATTVAPTNATRRGVAGFTSDGPLMGCACFDLVLPAEAVGLYIGVREWRGTRQAYCRIDNLFRENATVSFALDDMPPQIHQGRNRCPLLPSRLHRFAIRWDQRMFELSVDGAGVSVARLRDGAPDAVSPLAQVFSWIHVRPRHFHQMASFRPLPSFVQLNARITCALCHREAGLQLPRWAVCPLCASWICVAHCGQMPWRTCPRCPMQLMDYVGGSNDLPYEDAVDFFQQLDSLEPDGNPDKFVHVVCKVHRDHARYLERSPLALRLLPDPTKKSSMSKRLWEKTMFRARAIIDFLDQQQDVLLFRFLHALAEDLPTERANLLADLPHPSDCEDKTVWRGVALKYSLELHTELFQKQRHGGGRLPEHSSQERAAARSSAWQDTSGGATQRVGMQDLDTGARSDPVSKSMQNVMPTHSEWFRLSEKRAIAACKQAQRRARNPTDEMDAFRMEWERSFSPYICPSYGCDTSMIRLPVFSCAASQLPVVPETPANFLDFQVPDVQCETLARVHAHPRDRDISFLQPSHTYFVNGKPVPVSVTGLVHQFSQEFNPDIVVSKMMRSGRWPRPEYARVVDGTLVPLSSEEIKEKWLANSRDASSRGTWMHLQLEVFMNGGWARGTSIELRLFCQFLREFAVPAIAFRTEWCIYSEEDQIAGCIDFVAKCSPTEVIIFDWKRTKQLHSKYDNMWACMKPPLSHLPDCSGVHYRLQLNIYKYMLEKHYGVRVRAMHVVCLHPDNEAHGPFIDLVPDMSGDVQAVLQAHRSYVSQHGRADGWEEVSGGSIANVSQNSMDQRIQQELECELDRIDLESPREAGRNPPECPPPDDPETAVVLRQQPAPAAGEDESNAFALARKRRFLPGADRTTEAFRSMFQAASDGYVTSLAQAPEPPASARSQSIKDRTASHKAQVKQRFPHWPDELVRLAAGAIEIYRTRYTDIFVRDFVALLWIMVGDQFLRAHNGVCYLYHDHGAFEVYTGVPPESMFTRIKSYLQRLEGLFRLMPSTTRRTDEGLLDGIDSMLEGSNNVTELLCELSDAAAMSFTSSRRGRPARREAAEGAEGEPAPLAESWNVNVAQMLAKIAAPLQRDLLEERKLLQYVGHWCSTPSQREPGCAFQDCCVKYDICEPNTICIVNPDPSNNIYVRIPHPLRVSLDDPVLQAASARLQKFLSETFWCNEDFFAACCAAIALAKRGLNVDRCFIGESPGGTGQSLYSSHLHAVYGHNHAFVDPNLFHNEDEMRKQLEQFAHCCMITAQEAPETARAFQQDLFKKMVSADDLAARRPYGYVTRMLRVTGWKRIETNHIMSFRNVMERNFNSIHRRCLVWMPKAVFVDQDCLSSYGDAALDGIFPKDPTLRNFLESGPAIAATLHLQHGFEMKHSREHCYKTIDECAAQGPTENKMREACGLEPRQARDHQVI